MYGMRSIIWSDSRKDVAKTNVALDQVDREAASNPGGTWL